MDFKAMGANLGLDEDEFRELIDLFMETGRSDYDGLKAALEGGDYDAAARHAHTLAGASGNLGLMDLHTAAKQIEQAAVDKQLADASAQAAEMEDMFSALAGFIKG
jgi:HPt (histidine-containing phosphotransfer) domain-containing protein